MSWATRDLAMVPGFRCTSQSVSVTATRTPCDGSAVSGRPPAASGWRRSAGFIILAVHRGILGGTFDPPHVAHLIAGETAYHELGLDIVTFIPAGAPWQKQSIDVESSEHRWEMVMRAVAGVDYFEADDRELRRDGWTYTIDTLDSYPDDERITLIVGADTAASMPTWRRIEQVLQRAAVAVYPRPGTPTREVQAALRSADYTWLDAPEIDIRATALRSRQERGGSLRFLVRESVWDYINEHGLYGG